MDEREKQAFFGLLDEYFSSRPQFAAMFGGDAAPPPFSPTPAAAPPPPPAASRPPPPAARGIGHAIALYDYAGGQPEDLSFKENDRITVLEVGELPSLSQSLATLSLWLAHRSFLCS